MAESRRLRVLIASYNTNLQGNNGLPQDLSEWLSPSLSVVHDIPPEHSEAPDVVAVGFQELLPLQFGLAGLSQAVLSTRDTLIRAQIEQHLSSSATEKPRYTLVAKHARVGIALLLYTRDDKIAPRVTDVHIRGVGCGWMGMGNKGAVAIRFRLLPQHGEGEGEVFTFMTAHLAAHSYNLNRRVTDFQTIVSQLVFPPVSPSMSKPSQIYSTSHLFVFGDLNFRLAIAPEPENLSTFEGRESLREHDQLSRVMSEGKVMHHLQEGEFWKFKPTYKYILGVEDTFHAKRTPSWTDRVLFATHDPTVSIKPLVYTSVQSFSTSDHKPIVCLLLLPPTTASASVPLLPQPSPFPILPHAWVRIAVGTLLDRAVGWTWCALWLAGMGHAGVGLLNVLFLLGAAMWWFGAFT